MLKESKFYVLALHFVKGLGVTGAQQLLRHFGSAEAVFRAEKTEFVAFNKRSTPIWELLKRGDHWLKAEQTLIHADQHHYEIIDWECSNYPERLKFCSDAPLILYGKGPLPLNATQVVSVVGTRKATPYGLKLCKELIEGMIGTSTLIVSGLALGIDRCAHEAALKAHLTTIGILGHGIDMVYPPKHQQLVDDMCIDGGVLSEFPYGSPPDKKHFPIRNRIIAGLADVTVVVEAADKGGALITAELAHGYQRELAAFPGRIDQPYSAGCNALIVAQKAAPIRNANDLWALMNWEQKLSVNVNKNPRIILSEEEKPITKLLAKYDKPLYINNIQKQLHFEAGKLAYLLLGLEMKGIICALPGGYYELK
jgi:DNA processing protein